MKIKLQRLPVPVWIVVYIFIVLLTLPVLAYLGTFGRATNAPVTTTSPAQNITRTSVDLFGSTSMGGVTERGFQYGTDTNYGQTAQDTRPLEYGYASQFGTPGTDDGQFSQPSGVAVDVNGNIYVSDTYNYRIQKFDSNGNYISQFGSQGTGDGQFSGPRDLAFDSDGNLVVLDTDNNRIQKFDSNGNYISQFGSQGTGDGQFSYPEGIATDSSGHILVADLYNNRIQKFDSNGNYISQFGSQGTGDGQFSYPSDVTIDSEGNIYVSDRNNHRIQKFDNNGTYLSQFGSNGNAYGEFSYPYGIAVDSNDNIFVVDQNNHRIQKFDSNGTFVAKIGSLYCGAGSDSNGRFCYPRAVVLDENENVYVADNLNNRIQKFSGTIGFTVHGLQCGTTYHYRTYSTNSIGTSYGNDQTFTTSNCLGSVNTEGSNYITQNGAQLYGSTVISNIDQYGFEHGTDTNYGQVSNENSVTQSYAFDKRIGSLGSSQGYFRHPDGLVFDSSGNLFVADRDNNRIQKFDSNGTYLSQFGSEGSGDGQLRQPTDVAIDSVGNIYVTDSGNHRIQKFDSNGTYLSQFGSFGSSDGEFRNPNGVVFDSNGNIYILDDANVRIQKFDSNGTFITKWGSQGSGPGQFDTGIGSIAINANDEIIVSDPLNHRIQKFDSNGTFLSQFGSQGTGDGQFTYAEAVEVGANGDVYVTDSIANRIQKFDSNGTFITKWGEGGSENAQLAQPRGMTINQNGNVYVSDSANNRIQVFYSTTLFDANVYSYSCGQTIHYRAFVVSDGNTVYGSDQTVTTSSCPILEIPQNLSGQPSTKRIDLDWDDADNAYRYVLQYKQSNEESWTEYSENSIYSSNRTVDGLQSNTSYDFRIKSVDFQGQESDWSAVFTISTTEPQTYYISTCEELQAISIHPQTLVPGDPTGNYVLQSDIDCSDSVNWDWSDIANDPIDNPVGFTAIYDYQNDEPFSGSLDGQGYTISNLYQDVGTTMPASGIFFATNGSEIKNVTIDGFTVLNEAKGSIRSDQVSAAVVGRALNTTIENVKVIDLNMTVPSMGGVGGLIGLSSNTTITKSSVVGDMELFEYDSTGKFSDPYGVALDSLGNIYVADSGNHRIQKFDSNGTFIAEWGARGTGDGQFSYPSELAVDASNNIYVVDSDNERIQKFDSNGTYLSQFGSEGSGDGQFNYPEGIATDASNNIYVADTQNHRIQKFDSNGTYLSQFGSEGSGDGQLNYPKGIATDVSGNIFVTDQYNHRIQKFDSNGNYISQFGSQGSGDGQLNYPEGIATDVSGNIFVADKNNNRIQKFDNNGTYLSQFGSMGDSEGQFANPRDVIVAGNEVVVADTYNNRIQKFDQSGQHILSFGSFGRGTKNSDLIYGGLIAAAMMDGLGPDANTVVQESFVDIDVSEIYVDGYETVLVGGLSGGVGVSVKDSYAKGSIVFNSPEDFQPAMVFIGGALGQSMYSAENVYSLVDIETNGIQSEVSFIGGIASVYYPVSPNSKITNSFSRGAVESAGGGMIDFVGGGVGGALSFGVPVEISNVYFDQATSLQTSCIGGYLDESMAPAPEPEGVNCTAVNTDGQNSSYFINNATNPPLNQWDFTDVWKTVSNSTPELTGTLPPTPTIPGAPRNLAVSNAAMSSISIGWQSPNVTGYSPITDYVVQYKPTSSGTWLTYNDGAGTGTSATITGLNQTTSYDFRVAAVNTIGQGPFTSPISGSTVMLPSQPQNVNVELELYDWMLTYNEGEPTENTLDGVGFALPRVTWDAPQSGAPITSYEVEYRRVGTNDWIPFLGDNLLSREALIDFGLNDLQNIDIESLSPEERDELNDYINEMFLALFAGSTYEVRVAAVNDVGTGPFSAPQTIRTGIGASTCEGLQHALWMAVTMSEAAEEYPEEVTAIDPYIVQLNDIDCAETEEWNDGEGWVPVGSMEENGDINYPFRGTFNGNGFEIQNLYINVPDEEPEDIYAGLFGVVSDATIQNVTLSGGSIVSNAGSGGLVGLAAGATLIENVSSDVSVTAPGWVGGIVGSTLGKDDVTIRNVSSTAKLESPGAVATGGIVGFVLTGDQGLGQFNADSFAIDADGNVYTAGKGLVQKYDSDGRYITAWGNTDLDSSYTSDSQDPVYFSSEGKFSNLSLMQIEVDSAGGVYVSDPGNSRIQKFDSDGTLLHTIGGGGSSSYPANGSGTGLGEFSSAALQYSIDSNNNVYVLDSGNYRIQKFNSSGSYLTSWGSEGFGNGELAESLEIAVDNVDNIYVFGKTTSSYQSNYRIQKFSSTGDYVSTMGVDGSGEEILNYTGSYFIENPRYEIIDFDQNNNLYVLNYGRVKIYSTESTSFVGSFPILTNASSLAVNPTNGDVFVGSKSTTNSKLVKYNSAGTVLAEVATGLFTTNTFAHQVTYNTQNNSVYAMHGGSADLDKGKVVRSYNANLTLQLEIDGTENDLPDVQTNIINADYTQTYDTNQDPLTNGFSGGIVGASGNVVDFLNVFSDPDGGSDTLPEVISTDDSLSLIITDSNATLNSFNNCFGSGGVVGTVIGSSIQVNDSQTNITYNCDFDAFNTDVNLVNTGGIVGLSTGDIDINNTDTNLTFGNSFAAENTEVGVAAIGGAVGAQLTLGGNLSLSDVTVTGSLTVDNELIGVTIVGGLVGLSSAEDLMLENSVSDLDTTINAACVTAGCYVGGLIGTSGGFIGDGGGFGGSVAVYDSESNGDIAINLVSGDSSESLIPMMPSIAVTGGVSGMFFNDAAVISGFKRTGNTTVQGGAGIVGGVAGFAYAGNIAVDDTQVEGSIDVESRDVDLSDLMSSDPQFDLSLGVGGGIMGVMAAGDATIEKSYVSGDVSSPITAGGMIGATVGVDLDYDAIFNMIAAGAPDDIPGLSDIIRPGKITVINSYVSGDVSTKPLVITIPNIPSVEVPGGDTIEFPENPSVSFGGVAGGIMGVGVNASVINSYVSGNVTTNGTGFNFDLYEFVQATLNAAPGGTISPELNDTIWALTDLADTSVKGIAGGLVGFYFDRAPGDENDPGYKIENSFVAGQVQGSGQKGALFGFSPTYWFDFYANTNGAFSSPEDIATDSQGNMYVVDSSNKRIQKFDEEGLYISSFGGRGDGDGQFEANGYMRSITVDNSDNIYVVQTGTSRPIQKFSSTGDFIEVWGSDNIDDGVLVSPTHITYSPDGNVYVVDSVNSSTVIKKYDTTGSYISSWNGADRQAGVFTGSYRPTISTDQLGNVYSFDANIQTISKFTSSGNLVTEWTLPVVGEDDGYVNESKIFVDDNNQVYISDAQESLVYQYNSDGQLQNTWDISSFNTTIGLGFGASGNPRPYAFAQSSDNALYILDTRKSTVHKQGFDGVYQTSIGRPMILNSETEEVQFSASGGPEVAGSRYDVSNTQLNDCGSLLNGTLSVSQDQFLSVEQSFENQALSSDVCTPVNSSNSQPNYFKNNSTNPPLDQWDFTNIWKTEANDYPTFIGSTLPPTDTTPSTPRNLSISNRSTTSLRLNWLAPSSDGGSPITGYRVQYRTTGSTTWITAPLQGPTPTRHDFTGLKPNTSYQFRVAAINAIGQGDYSAPITGSTLAPTPPPDDDDDTPPNTGSTTNTTPPPDPSTPTTDTETNEPASGTPLVPVPPSTQPGTGNQSPTSQSPAGLNLPILGAVIGPLVRLAEPVPTAVARTIPWSLLFVLVALSGFYGYSSVQEQQRRKVLIELTNRFKASLAARATYLEITSHYIKTPLTKMQGVVELLKSGVIGSSSSSTTTSSQAALAATTTTLTIPENTIMAASSGLTSLTEHADQLLAEGQSLTGAQQAHISDFSKRQIISVLSHPGFWLPASVITSLTLLANVVFIQADKYDTTTINLASQILLGIIGILTLLVSLYFLQQAKAQKRLAQDQATIEADIRARQQQLIDNAANDLTTDLELLASLQTDIARFPKTSAYKQGITDLTTVIDQFTKLRDLTRSVPGVSWQTSTSAVVNHAITSLRSLADERGVTITTTGITKLPLANIEEAALLHLITAPLKNAIQASPQGSQVQLAVTPTTDHAIQLTITDHGSGIPADKLATVFEPFNSATGTDRFSDTGLGLDLYLAKTICEQYGAEIRLAGGVGDSGVIATLVLPQTQQTKVR